MSKSELLCGYSAVVLKRTLESLGNRLEELEKEGLAAVTVSKLSEYNSSIEYFLSEINAIVNNLEFSCRGIDRDELEKLKSWARGITSDLKDAIKRRDVKRLERAHLDVVSMKHYIPEALKRTVS
jgi:hypothetical protein